MQNRMKKICLVKNLRIPFKITYGDNILRQFVNIFSIHNSFFVVPRGKLNSLTLSPSIFVSASVGSIDAVWRKRDWDFASIN